jgi:hypothetical protein
MGGCNSTKSKLDQCEKQLSILKDLYLDSINSKETLIDTKGLNMWLKEMAQLDGEENHFIVSNQLLANNIKWFNLLLDKIPYKLFKNQLYINVNRYRELFSDERYTIEYFKHLSNLFSFLLVDIHKDVITIESNLIEYSDTSDPEYTVNLIIYLTKEILSGIRKDYIEIKSEFKI